MKKIILLAITFFICLPVFAYENIQYKNIPNKAKLGIKDSNWTTKPKNNKYYLKKTSNGLGNFSEFYSPDGTFLFSTGTQYEFIHKGALIGYSNFDLKFYEFEIKDDILQERELLPAEVQELFPEFKVLTLSEFSSKTNCLKLKKTHKNLRLILLNDTDRSLANYRFSSNNANFKEYELKGFIKIQKSGMIQFSRFGENSKNSPWYILLIR